MVAELLPLVNHTRLPGYASGQVFQTAIPKLKTNENKPNGSAWTRIVLTDSAQKSELMVTPV